MAVTAPARSQVTFICDTEAEMSTAWPDGCRVFCKDTKKFWVLDEGVWRLIGPSDGGGGVDGGANVGNAGVGVFKQLNGSTLEFKKLNPGSSKLTVTDDPGNNEVDLDVNANATVAASTDARLSDARTPLNHATSHQPGGGDAMAVDAAAATGSLRTIGTGALTAAAGNDSRLSDARTPLAHATSHKTGGSDAIKLDELAAPTDITTLNASTSAHGLLPKLPGGTATFLRADGAFAAPPGGGGGGSGLATIDFGAFPGKSDSFVDVATSGVVVTSLIEAYIRPVATADHSADEHIHETLKVVGTYLSDGNLRILAVNASQINEPATAQPMARFSGVGQDSGRGQQDRQVLDGGGKGTRIYGQWSIWWRWN